ncbi:hypothetical protein [Burkholderia orbicola]|uniref:hypothetical protein n=1 Tax=Burkholderia orbicola TaxID=2978683 RepID=UPI002FE1318C
MISTYNVNYLNALHAHDVYTFLNCVADDCLKNIAADSNVTPFMMDAALQVLRTRKDVELHVYEWECRSKRDERFRAWLNEQYPVPQAEAGYKF